MFDLGVLMIELEWLLHDMPTAVYDCFRSHAWREKGDSKVNFAAQREGKKIFGQGNRGHNFVSLFQGARKTGNEVQRN